MKLYLLDYYNKHNKLHIIYDEFRTSCRCAKCGNETKKFMKRENPRPNKNNIKLVHGLLKCQICKSVWNRDCNGATNIYKIANNTINELERPNYLCRNNNNSAVIGVIS